MRQINWHCYFPFLFNAVTPRRDKLCGDWLADGRWTDAGWTRRIKTAVNLRRTLTNLMERCQPVYVGVVDVGSLPEQRRHLLPVSGGAGGHEHGPLGEADFRPSRPGTARSSSGLRSGLIRLRAQPSLQLILPSLFGSFGPGLVSGRHLPLSVPGTDSAHGARGSGVQGLRWACQSRPPPACNPSPPTRLRPLAETLFKRICELHS